MYYPEELVEEVRARNDIVDVISGYVSLKKKGSNYWGCCPFHNEKTPSFSVSSNKQMYYCFGCHASGNVYTFLMKYDNEVAFVYMYTKPVDVAKLILQKEEVESVEWFDMEELDAALQPPRDQRFCVPMEGFQIAKQWLESRK